MNNQQIAAFWNEFAPDYVAAQNESSLAITTDLTAYLCQQQILPHAQVLDVGGGAGRFALPFAHVAQQVIINDISQRMLVYAQQKIKAAKLTNVTVNLGAWQQLALKPRVQVVFASMLPLEPTAVAAFSRLATKYAVLNRAVVHRDSLTAEIQKLLTITPEYDPTDDAAIFTAYQQVVRQLGFQPWQKQFTYQLTEAVTPEMLRAEWLDQLNWRQQLRFNQWLQQKFAGRTQIVAKQRYVFKTLLWRLDSR